MKSILKLIVIFCISTHCLSQDCPSIISNNVDKVTGKQSKSLTDPLLISQDEIKGIIINLYKSKKGEITFSITPVGASNCIEEGAKINILFRDQTRMELLSQNSFNCDGNVFVFMGGIFGRKKQWAELASKEIEIMRVWTSNGYVEESFESEESKLLAQAFTCLLD